MTIDDVYNQLVQKFSSSSECKIERNKTFPKTEDDGNVTSYTVDIAVSKCDENIMVIKEFQNESFEDVLYNCWYYCPSNVMFFVAVSKKGELLYKERPYCVYKKKDNRGTITFDYTLPGNDYTEVTSVTIETIIELVERYDSNYYKRISIEESKGFLTDNAELFGIDISDFIKDLQDEDWEFDNKQCWLETEAEKRFITCLLNEGKEIPVRLYRYSSFQTLSRIMTDKKHSLSSLISMNDITEVDYANEYLKKKNVRFIDKTLGGDKEKSVHTYITSLSYLEDNLTLWRLYGDDAKGICIVYETNKDINNEDFMLAKVSYADESKVDKKLDFIAKLMESSIGRRDFHFNRWYVWQHFFKPHEYEVEKEIRLLAFVDKDTSDIYNYEIKWVLTSEDIYAPILCLPLKAEDKVKYPLQIREVMIGSKFPNKEANTATIETKSKEEKLDLFGDDFHVTYSKIDSYR